MAEIKVIEYIPIDMNPENKTILVNRLKSFVWRAGGMLAGAGLNFLAENLGLFGFSPILSSILGLVIGELTKALNSK